MIKTDVLVIGGSVSGMAAANTAKVNNPDLNVTLIRKEEKVMVPCGIPYIFGSLNSSDENVIPDARVTNNGVEIVIDEINAVDIENKVCKTVSGEEVSYGKIIFATGSTPKVPGWLKGATLDNVFVIPKNKVYLDEIHAKLKTCKKVVVVGGGFIGVEVADELNESGIDVTVVEVLPHILMAVFDEEAAVKAEDALKARGVTVKTGSGIQELTGETEVNGIVLANGEKIEADAVILSMGYAPNTTLAKEAGLELNMFGHIVVDEYGRTAKEDIVAVGDCAQKRDFLTRKITPVMLASIAAKEGKVASYNLFGVNLVKNFKGTIAVFSTRLGDDVFASTGYTKNLAKRENLNIISAIFEAADKHPHALKGTKKQNVELIVMKKTGVIIGGTITGGPSVGELINALGIAIQNNMNVFDLSLTQIGTQPMSTASPNMHPLIKAADVAIKKLSK